MKRAFTLLEILIVITLLIILATAFIAVFNPQGQINKANDGKRKVELTSLNKLLEDWYNDHNCYPKPEEICYNAVGGQTTCNICGNKSTSPDFSPYMQSLPCDPQHPTKTYLYEVDDTQCPSTYWIYTNLVNTADPEIVKLNCQNGCGPAGNCNFNYGVASPDTSPQCAVLPPSPTVTPTSAPTPTPEGSYYCQSFGNCAFYNNQVWTCNPAYFDSQCTGSSNCNITGSCQRK